MNKRRLAVLLVLAMLAVSLMTGCAKRDNSAAFTTVPDISALPSDTAGGIALAAHTRGYLWFTGTSGVYVCVSLANGSGAAPNITSVTRDGGTVKVTYAEQSLAPTSSVGSYQVIKLADGDATDVTVADTKGNPLPRLELASGSYNGQIDTTSIEVTVAGGPAAFQLADSAKSEFEPLAADYLNLKTGDAIRFCYYGNAQGQSIITYIAEAK